MGVSWLTTNQGSWGMPMPDEGSGSKDRATVALVDAKVDGIRELIRAEFGFMRERIEPLAGAVRDVALLKSQVRDLEKSTEARITGIESRMKNVEDGKRRDRDWRRINLPTLLLSAAVGLASILGVLHTLGAI